jgi:hypothetical protein
MNTTNHFTLNGTTSKIDFKTTYKIPTAGTADAVAYSGITGIPTSWTDAQIPTLAIGKISLLQTALDGKAPTSHTHTTAQITGLDAALTGKQATLTSTNTIGVFNTTQFENVSSLIQIKSSVLGGGLWQTGTPSTRIYYNSGNVGIGTTDPQYKLHIRDDTTNTTALTIQNNFIPSIPTDISVVGATSTTIGTTERCISFPYSGTGTTKDYTFTTTENLICDVLIIGGGGAGGDSMGGGGGAGGVVYVINQTLATASYTVKVGRGGIGLSTGEDQGTIGVNQDGVESALMNSNASSYISLTLGGVSQQLRGYGGGGGGVYYNPVFVNGRNGGSGGGCAETNNNGFTVNTSGSTLQPATYWNGSTYVIGGTAGRQNTTTLQDYQAGGGGGLGNASGNYNNGNDGVAISITGTSQFYAAGGGAGQYLYASTSAGLGGSGIGGNGRAWNGSSYIRDATSGTNGTGSGGGGTAYSQAPVLVAGSGGSGIVIIRYRKSETPSTSSTIELLRGTTTDANHDWKIGNYDGDFKIKKSVNNVETDASIIYKNQLDGRDIFVLPDGDLNVAGTISVTGSISTGSYLQGSGGGGSFRFVRSDNWIRLRDTGESTHLNFAAGELYAYTSITSLGNINCVSLNDTGVVTIGGINDGGNIIKLAVYASGSGGLSAIFKHPNNTQGIGIKYNGLVALGTYSDQPIVLTTRGLGSFVVNNNAGFTKLQVVTTVGGTYGEIFGDWYVSGLGNEIYSGFRAVWNGLFMRSTELHRK